MIEVSLQKVGNIRLGNTPLSLNFFNNAKTNVFEEVRTTVDREYPILGLFGYEFYIDIVNNNIVPKIQLSGISPFTGILEAKFKLPWLEIDNYENYAKIVILGNYSFR